MKVKEGSNEHPGHFAEFLCDRVDGAGELRLQLVELGEVTARRASVRRSIQDECHLALEAVDGQVGTADLRQREALAVKRCGCGRFACALRHGGDGGSGPIDDERSPQHAPRHTKQRKSCWWGFCSVTAGRHRRRRL